MTTPLPVEISRLAAEHIRVLEIWWRFNRPKSLNAVREELERALKLITLQPRAGALAPDVALRNVRRIHLTRIWHYLYYRIHDNPERLEIIDIWSDSRGEGPPL
jgi:hypothetical protein